MDLNPALPTPLYLQLAEHLQRQIKAGIYAAGYKLPSERELAETFQVSRMTARQAIQQLVQQGVAHTQVGKGTFVTTPKIHQELRELTSFTQEMKRRGATPSSLVIKQEIRPAEDDEAGLLQIAPRNPVAVLERVRQANGKPLALETAHLNQQFCPGLFGQNDFSQASLYQVLASVYGVHLIWANQWIEARLPDKHEQEHLGIGHNAPVLSLTRVTYNEKDVPVELVRSVYIGERYQLRTTLQIRTED